jgi:hypothetical protein
MLGGDGFTFEALLPSDSLWMVKDITWAVAQLGDANSSSSSSSRVALQSIVDAANSFQRVW